MESIEQIKEGVSKLLDEKGCFLGSFKLNRNNKQANLEIVVDKDDDISMDEIVEITHLISDYLDEHSFIDGPYNLNICSAGAEKPISIERIDKYVSRYIYVHIINPIEGLNAFEGTLKEVNDDELTLEIRVKTRIKLVKIKKTNVDKIRLAIKF